MSGRGESRVLVMPTRHPQQRITLILGLAAARAALYAAIMIGFVLVCLSPVDVHAQNADTCTEAGGPAFCVGPEVDAFRYQMADGADVALGQGASEAAATAAWTQNFMTAYFNPCLNIQNNLPPYQPPQEGGGNASTGDYSQAFYSGVGQYWSEGWNLSAETITTRIPLVISGTRYNCSTPFGPFGAYMQRVRDVWCPAGFSPNLQTTPTNAYCWLNGSLDPHKNLGHCPGCERMVGNPINAAIGNKLQVEEDYRAAGPMPLQFTRSYNSDSNYWSPLGVNWRSNYDREIHFSGSVVYPTAYAYRPDGRIFHFKQSNGVFVPDADVSDRLVMETDQSGNITGWQSGVSI